MDNFRERQGLEESIRGAVTSFLELFPGDTVLSRGVHADASAASGSSGQQFPNRIAPSLLTANQTQIAHRLSAYLSHSIRDSDSLHRLFFRTYDNNTVGYNFQEDAVSAENVRLQNSLRECKKKEGEHLKVINALQDYLKNEVNRSADADKELRLKEDALVRVTAERNKFMKFINNIQTGSSQSFNSEREKLLKSTISTTAVASETAESYCGSFVRKKFGTSFYFGLIVSFRQPFFKVLFSFHSLSLSLSLSLTLSLSLSLTLSISLYLLLSHSLPLSLSLSLIDPSSI